MSARIAPLPAPYRASAFSTADAAGSGFSRTRLDHATLNRPFVGVRASIRPSDVPQLCRAYLPKMAEAEFFSHRTAALLHGMWLPLDDEQRMQLDVSVRKPSRAPRDARVRGHHLVDRPYLVRVRRGLRVANALETWCQLATVLSEGDLVIAGDSLLAKGRPGTASMLRHMLDASSDETRPCSRRLRRADVC